MLIMKMGSTANCIMILRKADKVIPKPKVCVRERRRGTEMFISEVMTTAPEDTIIQAPERNLWSSLFATDCSDFKIQRFLQIR